MEYRRCSLAIFKLVILNKIIMSKSEIDIKIEKGKKISEIISNINILENALNTLNNSIDITIGNSTSGNLMKYNVFSVIVWRYIKEVKVDVSKTIYKLKEELDTLIK